MTELSSTTEAVTRAQIAAFLPEAIQKSLESYHQFMRHQVPAPAADEKADGKDDASPGAGHAQSSQASSGQNPKDTHLKDTHPKDTHPKDADKGGGKKSMDANYIKQFADFHKAAKVAISHVELLIKLAKWADLPDDKNDTQGHDQAQLAALLALAQQDVAQYTIDCGDGHDPDNDPPEQDFEEEEPEE